MPVAKSAGRRVAARRGSSQLLAGLRRRAVDAAARHRLPDLGLHARPVLPVAGDCPAGTRCSTGSTARSPNSPISWRSSAPDRRSIEENAHLAADDPSRREAERARLQGMIDSGGAAQARAGELETALDSERQATGRALSQVEILNQQIAAMRRQLAALEEALARLRERATRRARPASPISAAASTSRWRSGCRNSPATAPTSSAACGRSSAAGRTSASSATASCSSRRCCSRPARRCCARRPAGELDRIASRPARTRAADPAGHPVGDARRRPHRSAPDRDGAVPVELGPVGRPRHRRGAGPHRPGRAAASACVAAGFGEFQPLDRATTEEAYARNRRIELKLTER